MIRRVVQDDDPSAPAGGHVGLQRRPEQGKVPRKDDEDREVPVREGHGRPDRLAHNLGQVTQQHLRAVHV